MDKGERGLTLVELMISLVLLAVLLQFGLPAIRGFVDDNRSLALRHSLERAVHQARALAVSHRVRVELCGSSDGLACDSDWSRGWLIRKLESGKEPASTSQATTLDARSMQLHWAGFRPHILFHPGGYSTAGNGRFYLCRGQALDWQLVLNRQGRLRQASAQENIELGHRCQ